ncbi:hypothetical protein BDZ45DRAFT_725283 [Acephala macrosclerotiorum]|nr:hypothetical protein BDZ45DRAFT_725283 [Acephala macrosclerotiorum]
MIGKSVIDRVGPEVLALLPDSGTIKIKCLSNSSFKATIRTVSLPEVLACAVSSLFRQLCKDTKKRIFTSDEVLGEKLKDRYHASKWLYGGNLLKIPGNCYDHWYFGQRIGSPLFQNDAMRLLISTVDVNKESLTDMFLDHYDHEDLGIIWRLADFSVDEELGYDNDLQEVHWGNKQMLKFVLDVFAFVGTKDEDVAAAIAEGGASAVHIAKFIETVARDGRSDGAPWEEKNMNKYLVDESLPEGSVVKSIILEGASLDSSAAGLKRKLPTE